MSVESPNRILVKEDVARTYIIRMSRDVSLADDFEDEFQVLAAAGPNDLVKILINSDGGNLASAQLICKAIRECEAHTVAFIGMFCASAATAIALACDEWEIDDNSSFMIHTATYGLYGKAPEVAAQHRHMERAVSRFCVNTYTGFLTPEEIQAVIDGKDYWFHGEELAARLTSYAEFREAVYAAVDSQEEPE